MSFKKRVEDFVCERCGTSVTGTGYTNHCTNCLWSKHVDNDPGDRLATCAGMMEPVGVEKAKDSFVIVHRCENCAITRRNSVTLDDNFDNLAAIAKKIADKTMGSVSKK